MDEKLRLIIEGSADIFSKHGIRCVSMDDLSKQLRISKKTLYQYVDNKKNLLEKISEFYSNEFCNSMQEIEKKNLNAIDTLLTVSQLLNDHWKRYRPSLSFEMNKYYPEIAESLAEIHQEQTFKGIIQNLNQGVQEGLYREDLNIEITAQIYIKKIRDLHDPESFDPTLFATNTIFRVMFENHIRGIANEKGTKYFEERIKNLKYD